MTWNGHQGKKQRACALCCVTSEILPQGCCRVTRWNQCKSNIYRGEGESRWLAAWHYFSSSVNQLWRVSYLCLCEGTKDQLDALTNDIKGNANVVRTKLKCECSHDAMIVTLIWYLLTPPHKSWCCVLLFNAVSWLLSLWSHGAQHAQRWHS